MFVKKFALHPFLITLYAVVALYANNVREIAPHAMIRPIVACVILTTLILSVLIWVTREWVKAAVITSFLVFLFFSYGHFYQFLRANPILGMNLGRHSILGTVYIFVLIGGLILLSRKRDFNQDVTLYLNLVSIVLLVFPVFSILKYELRPSRQQSGDQDVTHKLESWQESILAQSKRSISVASEYPLPDIYVIVLDMYGRQDALSSDLGFDNSEFIANLSELGFMVADCSRSNYAQTRLSLASFLNMDYLPEDTGVIPIDDVLEQAIKHSLVRELLARLGYKMISFENGFNFSEIPDADQYYAIQPSGFFDLQFQPFEAMLVKTTLLRLPVDLHPQSMSSFLSTITFPYGDHVRRVAKALEVLGTLPQQQEPKFVYAHLMIPHPPYIYNADGSIRMDDRYYREALNQPISEEYYQDGYKKNLEYTNSVILPLVGGLISESRVPPVILLLSDHGMRNENRMENLIAIYDQGKQTQEYYSSITPVNVFRILLNRNFGTSFPLIEDRSFYSEYPDRYLLSEVQEKSPACRR